MEKMNGLIKSTEIETVIVKLSTSKSQGLNGFTDKFYQIFGEESTPILLKVFQKKKLQRKEHSRPPSPCYQNQTKIPQKKKITSQYHQRTQMHKSTTEY